MKDLDSGEICHQQRLALLNEAYALGFHSFESLVELFRNLNDFGYSTTSYQVKWFLIHLSEKDELRPHTVAEQFRTAAGV